MRRPPDTEAMAEQVIAAYGACDVGRLQSLWYRLPRRGGRSPGAGVSVYTVKDRPIIDVRYHVDPTPLSAVLGLQT